MNHCTLCQKPLLDRTDWGFDDRIGRLCEGCLVEVEKGEEMEELTKSQKDEFVACLEKMLTEIEAPCRHCPGTFTFLWLDLGAPQKQSYCTFCTTTVGLPPQKPTFHGGACPCNVLGEEAITQAWKFINDYHKNV